MKSFSSEIQGSLNDLTVCFVAYLRHAALYSAILATERRSLWDQIRVKFRSQGDRRSVASMAE